MVACAIIIGCILDKVIEKIKDRYKTRPSSVAQKTIKRCTIKYILICLSLFLGLSALYLLKLYCNLGNDILSIISIGLSLLDEELATLLTGQTKKGEK